ncbi:putative transposase|nr:putative transposase [Candidatus Pantoea persica]
MGLPKTTKGIREILARLTKNTPALVRKRPVTKAYEYHIDCLPIEAQCAIRERHLQQLMISAPVDDAGKQPTVSKVSTDPEKLGKLDVYRRCPAIVDFATGGLLIFCCPLGINRRQESTARARQICGCKGTYRTYGESGGKDSRYGATHQCHVPSRGVYLRLEAVIVGVSDCCRRENRTV